MNKNRLGRKSAV